MPSVRSPVPQPTSSTRRHPAGRRAARARNVWGGYGGRCAYASATLASWNWAPYGGPRCTGLVTMAPLDHASSRPLGAWPCSRYGNAPGGLGARAQRRRAGAGHGLSTPLGPKPCSGQAGIPSGFIVAPVFLGPSRPPRRPSAGNGVRRARSAASTHSTKTSARRSFRLATLPAVHAREPNVSRVLSWTVIYLGRPLPGRLERPHPGGRRAASCLPYWVLLRVGFAWRTGRPVPGGLLHRRCTLAAEAAVCFCGTFLEVAPTGRYPAPCPAQPGLSSDAMRPQPSVRLAPKVYHPDAAEPTVASAESAEPLSQGASRRTTRAGRPHRWPPYPPRGCARAARGRCGRCGSPAGAAPPRRRGVAGQDS